ncbi:MAG: DUF3276 family protein [Treponema sp.]|jgi:hypothetical protein|nr:DUF3276 family protein [Treponema sp.]
MGIRGEIFSTRVQLQNRTYFFNVKENRLGDLYLNIVESKNRDSGGFDRQSVILFEEDMPEFLKGFDESLRVLEKAAREKRRKTAPAGGRAETAAPRRVGRGPERNSGGPPAGPRGGKRVRVKRGPGDRKPPRDRPPGPPAAP